MRERHGLEARSLELSWGRRRVLSYLDVSFSTGGLCAVLGANGSGKSTLLKALGGLISPSGGQVLLDSRPILSIPRFQRARKMAWLSQGFQADWPFSVREFVCQGRFPHTGSFRPLSAKDRTLVDQALERCDLLALGSRAITELSGGELQRTCIARALAQEARILLLDEPLSQLDIGHQKDILALLESLAVEGHTIIMALHDLNLALAHCDRALVLAKGQLLRDGEPERVIDEDLIREAWGTEVFMASDPRRQGKRFILW